MSPPDNNEAGFEGWCAERNREGLRILCDNFQYADHLGACPTAFAASMKRLREAGMEDGALQWLLWRGYLLQVAADGSLLASSGGQRRRRPPQFQDDTSFILTDAGVAFASGWIRPALPALDSGGRSSHAEIVEPDPLAPDVAWDAAAGVLCVSGVQVRRVRKDASVLREILDAFQRADWPLQVRILPTDADSEAKLRLRNCVQRLNRGCERAIEFHTCDHGTAVCWRRDS